MRQTMFRMMKDVLPPKASFQLRVLKSNLVDRELRELRRFARVIGGPNLDAVDIGANSGIYSAALSTYFGRVIAVEPNPACVGYMRQVLPFNCSVVAAAVSDVEGRTVLRVPIVGGASETTRATISSDNAFSDLDVATTQEIDVAMQSVDGLARTGLLDPDRLGLLKIDVEGHEAAVLRGAEAVLRSARPGLCIEMERRHGTRTTDSLKLLANLDYRPIRYKDGRYTTDDAVRPDAVESGDDVVNLFFAAGDRLRQALAAR